MTASDNARPEGWTRFIRFFGASAAGLAVDLIGFTLLLFAGVEPGVANAISSVTSVTVVYFLATRHAFGERPRPLTYVLFVAWYLASIATFSWLIQFAATESGVTAFFWKLLSIPVSFLLNYSFSTVLFRRRRS